MEVSTIADNIGATQSTGYEFSLNTVNLTGPFKWNTTLNISSYNDRWKERNPDVVLAPYEKEDAPIRAIYGCVSDGILQIGETPPASMPDLLPGQMKVKDLNGFDPNDGSKLLGHPDGKIDAADRIYLGSTDPKVIIGFGNMFEYKNFDLNIFFYGMFGQYVANSNRAKYGPSGCEYILQRQNYSKEVLERWTPDNPTNKFPSGFYSAYYGGDDWLLEKVSFVRCKNITLGYSFPHKWIHKVFSQARIYVDVENPFIITNYQGLDPEMDSKGGYPSQRTYSIGIDITFKKHVHYEDKIQTYTGYSMSLDDFMRGKLGTGTIRSNYTRKLFNQRRRRKDCCHRCLRRVPRDIRMGTIQNLLGFGNDASRSPHRPMGCELVL